MSSIKIKELYKISSKLYMPRVKQSKMYGVVLEQSLIISWPTFLLTIIILARFHLVFNILRLLRQPIRLKISV